MAEELQYTSDSATNKRKYDDNSPSPGGGGPRRATGFSSQSPPAPMDDIQLAKQRAQEIAARLFNAAEVKRPRLDNGDSNEDAGLKSFSGGATPPMTASYGYGAPNKRIEIPNGRVGVIIGKGGETIKYLQLQSGAKIQVTRDMDADPHSQSRGVELTGTPEQIAKAEQLINDVLSEADAGGSGLVSRRITGQQSGGAEQFVMMIPNNKVGLVIGKGGETIKTMQATTGARIQVIPLHLPPGDTRTERTCQIDGTSDQIEAAKQMVNEVISENRLRNPPMGGYSQQGYQARPPTSWGQGGGAPMQQPGYGYMQPGAYPGQNPQYNTGQAAYSGYPQPTTGGYGAGWDQASAPQNQQTSQGAAGYDYYSQQPPAQHQQASGGPGAPTENASYGYGQAPASGYSQAQGYGQDGYGGYPAAPAQSYYGSQANSGGYDQQGYNSASGYGNASNPTPDGTASYGSQGDVNQTPQPAQSATTGQQGYVAGQQPSPNPSYPSQGATGYAMPPSSQAAYGSQPPAGYGAGYGTPQAQKAPVSQAPYGQPQQSPSAQGGYSQSAPAYPSPAQSGYAQPDANGQRPPASYGAPTAQPGYAAPPYGAPAVAQQSYGQQPPYNSAYGGGYSQPPAYGDSSSSQPTQPAKTSSES
ncbi:RNA metabolism protein [Lithospermum erythrorhizon]|uniref:RNA metabolism protein n=1 Tax=Lithospermum erythrorhizon TaxID=34254 RepID=A0AAV3NWZ6_LITER